jgi:ribonuclease P protein component
MDAPPPAIERLKRRPEFLAAAKGRSTARGAVAVQALAREGQAGMRVGFTATRKIGGAVVRNRAKRRLREAARLLLPQLGRPGFDYVFIARSGTAGRPWARLLDDVKTALISLAPD